jgi:hypothetical protein
MTILAIQTKYHGPTATLGSRCIARTLFKKKNGQHHIVRVWERCDPEMKNHLDAAHTLVQTILQTLNYSLTGPAEIAPATYIWIATPH